ncbi:MAG: MoaD/ThiS family protein [Candidatus Brockarchaeota archaeon]|nr:MoaD/ThiS family protein [Candidatus Brockarchaeota archaeon]
MKVRVKLFASHREAVGKAEVEVEVAGRARVKDLVEQLIAMYPKLGGAMRGSSIYSLNHKIVDGDAKLSDGDVVSIFPPVGGG